MKYAGESPGETVTPHFYTGRARSAFTLYEGRWHDARLSTRKGHASAPHVHARRTYIALRIPPRGRCELERCAGRSHGGT